MKKDGTARQITRMRNVAKLTQPELAKILEVNVRTLARWEGGESSPKEGILQEIARVCHNINPDATIFQDMAFTPTEDATWDISIADSPSDGLESTISGKGLSGHGGKEPTVSIGIHAFAGAGGPIELFEHEPIRSFRTYR
jgi:transcriptional regulator with XRE-family HTH domain